MQSCGYAAWANASFLAFLGAVALICCTTGAARADEHVLAKILYEREEFACLTKEETTLLDSLNEHRAGNRLPPVSLSRSLTIVARLHAADLVDNRPELGTDSRGRACNLHSWSDRGFWSPFCYTADHRNLPRMQEKAWEITRGEYAGIAYENVYWTSAPQVVPSGVLNAWRRSQSHNALILEAGNWRGSDWSAIGVGIYRNVAVVWLGSTHDPLGPLPRCEPPERGKPGSGESPLTRVYGSNSSR